MSRWICIDDICIPSDENDWEELVAFADAIAEQEPMELIRCRECKYWNMVSNGCMRNPSVEGWQADDFCSYGQRNSSEKPNNLSENTTGSERAEKYPYNSNWDE